VTFSFSFRWAFGFGLAIGIGAILGSMFKERVFQERHAKNGEITKGISFAKDAPQEAVVSFTFDDVLMQAPLQSSPEFPQVLSVSPDAESKADLMQAPTQGPTSQDRIMESLARVLGQETPRPVRVSLDAQLPTGTGSRYAVQVASFEKLDKAQDLARGLQLKGYPARVVAGELLDKSKVFRVRLHGFKTFEEADAERLRFEHAEGRLGLTIAQ
jgi:cell division septation protein DedD